MGHRRPRLGAIHLDRLGFDEALERKVRSSEHRHLAETRVSRVSYDADSDRISSLQLENGRELPTRHVFDASDMNLSLRRADRVCFARIEEPRRDLRGSRAARVSAFGSHRVRRARASASW